MDRKKLEYFHKLISETILSNQNVVTGLIPASVTNPHAWVRDNVYAILSVWGLALAFRKVPDVDEDRTRGYELEMCVVRLMRGILTCFMRQSNKVQSFKVTQRPGDALHAKFDSRTCMSVVGDYEWGHLQIDAVSLFLLMMAQITASGIRLIWTPTEVLFVQNLIFYIEFAYRIPDYGIWERGDKTNHGCAELNSSSVGMAKAALEAMNELDLYGSHGGYESTVHVLLDESQQCSALLESMLPRESCSKETDAALLSIISYPAFALDDEELIELTRNTILQKLEGKYGCKRFMRDGYRTPIEDASRLHYELWELRQFENIECEWPLFFCYLLLDAQFRNDQEDENKYWKKLESLLFYQSFPGAMYSEDVSLPLVPESYTVAYANVDAERSAPGSQKRAAVGKLPHIWAQSLYILASMIHEGVLLPGEIDPLGRRMITSPKPDLVVQVCAVAENEATKERLLHYQLNVPTFQEINSQSSVKIFPAKLLTHLYKHLGYCQALNLKGREDKEVGVLTTSRVYRIGDQTIVFAPQFVDAQVFYLGLDFEFTVDTYRTCMAFLRRAWTHSGRPLLILPIYECHFPAGVGPYERSQPALVTMLKKMQSGLINGTRVILDRLEKFSSTSCTTRISFVRCLGHFNQKVDKHVGNLLCMGSGTFRHRLGSRTSGDSCNDPCRRQSNPPGSFMNGASFSRQVHQGITPPVHSFMRRQSVALASVVSADLNISDDERDRDSAFLAGNYLQQSCDHKCLDLSNHAGRPTEKRHFKSLAGKGNYFWDMDDEEDEATSLFKEASALGMFALGTGATSSSLLQLNRPHNGARSLHEWGPSNTPPRLRVPEALPEAKSTDSMYLRRLITSHTHLNQLSHSSTSLLNGSNTSPISVLLYNDDSGVSPAEEESLSPEAKTNLIRKRLVERLMDSQDLFEQMELVYNLYVMSGFSWDTQMDPEGECTVKDLIKELYERAGQLHQWWVVRFTAGLLRKRPEHLARALADILVLQKQVTIGLPPEPREKVITTPLPPIELETLIHNACEEDYCMAMLTEEILIYLSMFSRTEPTLLRPMLRLRVGLIIQVMASELGRSLRCAAEEASMALFNVSPYQVKTLLHHILSGKEFEVQSDAAHPFLSNPNRAGLFNVHSPRFSRRVSRYMSKSGFSMDSGSQRFTVSPMRLAPSGDSIDTATIASDGFESFDGSKSPSTPAYINQSHGSDIRRGQWLRRRKIDGSLNRVPPGFYEQLWHVLERSIAIHIGSFTLNESLTREMTEGETKFALQVEGTMNSIPIPEYRQLLVECISVINTIVNFDKMKMIQFQPHIQVEELLQKAHEQFLKDQARYNGDATICCASSLSTSCTTHPLNMSANTQQCRGACGICFHFYDTSPSGKYGTMTYIVRALSTYATVPLNPDGAYEFINCSLQ